MDRKTLDSLDKETLIRLILSQVEAIERLTREVEALRADNAKLRADNAALRAKLDLPPKTPENSSTPPSQGHKVSEASEVACRGAPSAPSQSDGQARCIGQCLPALRRLLFGYAAVRLRGL